MIKSRSGFTIVELLIVIVVIAILAAISIVAYTGIQQRATNISIISTVNQTVKLISGYIAANGTYPLTTNTNGCVIPASTCTASSTARSINTTFNGNLATIGSLPILIPDAQPGYNGIVFDYNSSRTFNGSTQPLILLYSLRGGGKPCGVTGVTDGGGTTMNSSTTGYTHNSGDGNYTICVVSVPGP